MIAINAFFVGYLLHCFLEEMGRGQSVRAAFSGVGVVFGSIMWWVTA